MPTDHTTRFVDVPTLVELVRRIGLPRLLDELCDELAQDFRRWADFDKTARTASHSAAGVIELMPVADAEHYSFKYVNGHPGNPALGLPTVMAVGLLADAANGWPLLLSELTLTTALRTAAVSALAARAVARPGARRMALIGCGAQSEFQALAFHHLLGISELSVHDRDPAAVAKLCRHLQGCPGLTVHVAGDARAAVRGADIVTTLTAEKAHVAVVTADMLEPGMHINAVGGDAPGKTELDPSLLHRAQVFVEFEPQTRIEGEIQQLPPGFPVTELWRVLGGQHPGRRSADAVTVFDSVGFALEDFTALRYLHRHCTAMGLGRLVHLVPGGDPKNLFGPIACPDALHPLGNPHPHQAMHVVWAQAA